MHYLGGKFRVANAIAAYIHLYARNDAYWEPFVGAAWVMAKVQLPRRYGSDINLPMISLFKALQDGWLPPGDVSEDEYQAAKALPDTDPLKAFVGIGCSWGGKWFGGYARDPRSNRNFAAGAKHGLLDKLPHLRGATFFHADFFATAPPEPCMTIYLSLIHI